MNEVLTIEEIKARYPSEHVLLEDPQTNPDHQVLGGRVLWHSTDQEEVYRKGIELRPRRFAFVFTGEFPEDIVYIPMYRYMTRSEIEAEFPSEWVLLADPKKDSQKRVEGGFLLRHSKNREDIDTIPQEKWPKNAAVLYTGTIPDGVVVVL